jgi:protein-tyrosine phosphatase
MNGRNILVHCFAGISRSSTTVIAYMMKELGYTFRKALAHCKARRKEVLPNSGFQR